MSEPVISSMHGGVHAGGVIGVVWCQSQWLRRCATAVKDALGIIGSEDLNVKAGAEAPICLLPSGGFV